MIIFSFELFVILITLFALWVITRPGSNTYYRMRRR
jgi:hypothetical protein